MVSATRTLGPLHFEDLEPKRFEDLCRQLVYDFKTWRRLDATGRAGSDDGFDARGYEIVDADAPSASETDDEGAAVVGIGDRLWLVMQARAGNRSDEAPAVPQRNQTDRRQSPARYDLRRRLRFFEDCQGSLSRPVCCYGLAGVAPVG